MKHKILFSPRALHDLQLVLEYLDKEWGISVSEKFLDRIDNLLDGISETSLMYVCVNKKKKIHKCVVNKNVTLYYRIRKNEVELITFFQSHQHQSKRNL
jgi:plasmid stabilization system protein ParE